MSYITSFLDARNIAVIGASRSEEKVGNIIFKNLYHNSHLNVYPVNPNAETILGKQAFINITKVPVIVDLAIIATPAQIVPKILNQCALAKVKNVMIISAGFEELGNEELKEQIQKILDKTKIKLIGPNVLGIIDPYRVFNASFFNGMPNKGYISFISQSGAIGTSVLDSAIKNNIGISKFFSIGNAMDLSFPDFIDYLGNDRNTRVICLYMESLKQSQGKDFIDVCKRVSKRKPIIILKSGKSEQGEQAAKSHTAALASDSRIYSGAFKQAGCIEVDSINQLIKTAEIFSKYGYIGNKACIITNAGGLGVLTADYCSKNNIQLPMHNERVLSLLKQTLPKEASKSNPIDLLGDATSLRYKKIIDILDRENYFDFFIVLLTPQYMTDSLSIASTIINRRKPIIACFAGGNQVEKAKQALQGKIPIFNDIKDLCDAAGKIK